MASSTGHMATLRKVLSVWQPNLLESLVGYCWTLVIGSPIYHTNRKFNKYANLSYLSGNQRKLSYLMTQPVSRHIAPTQDPQGLLFVVFLKLFFCCCRRCCSAWSFLKAADAEPSQLVLLGSEDDNLIWAFICSKCISERQVSSDQNPGY